jgi:hypothetical protein
VIGGGSAQDPYALAIAATNGYSAVGSKAVRDPRIVAGENTFVAIAAGQSNISNSGATAYTPTNSTKVDQINIFDGGTYAAVDPLLGCDGATGNVLSRLGDKLINAGVFARCIFIPIAISGTSITSWISSGSLNQLIILANKRALAVGLTPTAVLWAQGETDGQNGMAQATYENHFNGLVTQIHGLGYTAPWFVAQSTLQSNTTNAAIRAALAAVVNGSTKRAGPDTDTLTGGTNRVDGTHFTATGADSAATLWKNAIDAVF